MVCQGAMAPTNLHRPAAAPLALPASSGSSTLRPVHLGMVYSTHRNGELGLGVGGLEGWGSPPLMLRQLTLKDWQTPQISAQPMIQAENIWVWVSQPTNGKNALQKPTSKSNLQAQFWSSNQTEKPSLAFFVKSLALEIFRYGSQGLPTKMDGFNPKKWPVLWIQYPVHRFTLCAKGLQFLAASCIIRVMWLVAMAEDGFKHVLICSKEWLKLDSPNTQACFLRVWHFHCDTTILAPTIPILDCLYPHFGLAIYGFLWSLKHIDTRPYCGLPPNCPYQNGRNWWRISPLFQTRRNIICLTMVKSHHYLTEAMAVLIKAQIGLEQLAGLVVDVVLATRAALGNGLPQVQRWQKDMENCTMNYRYQ